MIAVYFFIEYRFMRIYLETFASFRWPNEWSAEPSCDATLTRDLSLLNDKSICDAQRSGCFPTHSAWILRP